MLTIVGIICLAGCSGDSANPEAELIGTWKYSYENGDGCIENSELIFERDGMFTVDNFEQCESEEDFQVNIEGTWDIKNGILNMSYTSVYSSNPGVEYPINEAFPIYYFITSTGKLAMLREDQLYTRVGSGEGLVGTWLLGDTDCGLYVTYDYDESFELNFKCGPVMSDDSPNSIYGTYSLVGDHLSIRDTDGVEIANHFFKLFENRLAIPHYLYAKE